MEQIQNRTEFKTVKSLEKESISPKSIETTSMIPKSPNQVNGNSDNNGSRVTWGVLHHINSMIGTEYHPSIPNSIPLKDKEVFIGRFAMVDGKSKKTPTHHKQVMIPCPFVSATHFQIRKDSNYNSNNDNNSVNDMNNIDFDENRDVNETERYVIKDYSKNGTFVNGELVGLDSERELKNGDIIAFIFHGETKIVYEFSVNEKLSSEIYDQPTKKVSIQENEQNQEEERCNHHIHSTHSSSFSRDISSVNDVFANQLFTLREEKVMIETRLSSLSTQIEDLTKENNHLQRENRMINQTLESRQEEIKILTEQMKDLESNHFAYEARIRYLSEQLTESQSLNMETKTKINTLHQELEFKSQLLSTRESIVEDMNRGLLQEKSYRLTAEKEVKRLENSIHILENKYTTVCQEKLDNMEEIKTLHKKMEDVKERNAKIVDDMKLLRQNTFMKIKEIQTFFSTQMQSFSDLLFGVEEEINRNITTYLGEYQHTPTTNLIHPSSPSSSSLSLRGSVGGVGGMTQESRLEVGFAATVVSSSESSVLVTLNNSPTSRKLARFRDDINDSQDNRRDSEDSGELDNLQSSKRGRFQSPDDTGMVSLYRNTQLHFDTNCTEHDNIADSIQVQDDTNISIDVNSITEMRELNESNFVLSEHSSCTKESGIRDSFSMNEVTEMTNHFNYSNTYVDPSQCQSQSQYPSQYPSQVSAICYPSSDEPSGSWATIHHVPDTQSFQVITSANA